MSGCKIEVSPLSHQLAGSPVIESEGWVLVLGIALGACRPFSGLLRASGLGY